MPKVLAASYTSARVNEEAHAEEAASLPALRLAQLRAIYKGAPVGLCFVDTRLRYVSMNQRYADFIGKPIAAIINAPVEQMLPDIYSAIQPLLARALKGESIANEVIIRAETESQAGRKVLVSYEPVRDEASEIAGISIAVLDVSDRYPEDVQMPWVRDAQGNLTEISPQWVALTGMTREQALNLGSLEALHPDDRALGLSALREALRTKAPIDVTCRLRTRDGDYRWIRARGYPRYDHSGEFIGWYGGAEDLEEKERLERALHEEQSGPKNGR